MGVKFPHNFFFKMSTHENTFIKWVGGIAAALIISGVIGLIGMAKAQARMEVNMQTQKEINTEQLKAYQNLVRQQFINQENTNTNFEKELNSIRETHKNDVALIRDDINDIKHNQNQIRNILQGIKQ